MVNSSVVNDENNLPQGRTVIQYEREKREDMRGRGRYQQDEEEPEKWFIFATVVNINDSKILICIDNELSMNFYDIFHLVGGKRDSLLDRLSQSSFDKDKRLDDKEKGLLFKGNLIDRAIICNLIKKKDIFDELYEEDQNAEIIEIIKKSANENKMNFAFEDGMNILYTYVEHNCQ